MRKQPIRTVRGRYILIIILLVFSILIVLSFFSYQMIQTTIENRGKSYMESSTRMIAHQMDEEYQHVLQISQHMTSHGVVGKQVNEILRSEDMYDLGEAKRAMIRNLQTVTAIGKQVELATYYMPENSSIFATTFLPRDSFSPTEGLRTVRKTKSVTFHAVHESQSRFSNHDVLSVAWPDTFASDLDLIIYVEARTSVPEMLEEVNAEETNGYMLFQLTPEEEICYCSNPTCLKEMAGKICFSGEDGFRMSNEMVWCKNQSASGFYYVLAIPRSVFYQHVLHWFDYLITGVLIALILVAAAVYLFNRLILQKLQMIVDAVNAVSRPELRMTSQRTGMMEYDNLMERFENLLEYARQLIEEVKRQEEQKAKLELERLYYQINPHFLMNSLNSLYWLARLNHQKEISEYTHRLMELLNYSLGRSGKGPTLRRELEVIRDYLALEQMKHSFSVDYQIEEGSYLDSPTPRLFLQPVVENAVSHGMDTDGHLRISVHPDDSGTILTIEDDGCGIEPERLRMLQTMEQIQEHAGIGLRYTVSMLRQFYGNAALLKLENRPEGGTRATIRLYMWKESFHDQGTHH